MSTDRVSRTVAELNLTEKFKVVEDTQRKLAFFFDTAQGQIFIDTVQLAACVLQKPESFPCGPGEINKAERILLSLQSPRIYANQNSASSLCAFHQTSFISTRDIKPQTNDLESPNFYPKYPRGRALTFPLSKTLWSHDSS